MQSGRDSSKEIPVLYVLGSARSGSTLLSILLGQHPEVGAFGELVNLPSHTWLADTSQGGRDSGAAVLGGAPVRPLCSCGKPGPDCPLWIDVLREWSARNANVDILAYDRYQRSLISGWSSGRLLLNAVLQPQRFREHLELTRDLFVAMCEVSGKAILVDSSKSPGRALLLSMVPGLRLHLVHLVRDARAVCWSSRHRGRHDPQKRSRGESRMAAPLRSGLWWSIMQFHCTLLRRALAADSLSLRLRYEDLVSDPHSALEPIASMVGLDFSQGARAFGGGASLSPGHHIAGNRMRMGASIRRKPDFEWMQQMPENERRSVDWTAGWLLRWYGYD